MMKSFSNVQQSEQVEIDEKKYVIVEMDANAYERYQKEVQGKLRTKIVMSGVGGSFEDSETRQETEILDSRGSNIALLSETLFEAKADGSKGKPLSKAVVGSWLNKVIEALATIATEVNQLDKTEDEKLDDAAKN
jgi:hypothetical protein